MTLMLVKDSPLDTVRMTLVAPELVTAACAAAVGGDGLGQLRLGQEGEGGGDLLRAAGELHAWVDGADDRGLRGQDDNRLLPG